MAVDVFCYSTHDLDTANRAIDRLLAYPEFADGPFWIEPPAMAARPGHQEIAAEFGKTGVQSVFLLQKSKFSDVPWQPGIDLVRLEFGEPSMLALLNNEQPR